MFYIKLRDLAVRTELISFAKAKDIDFVFHYVALHSSVAGKKFGYFHGDDTYTTAESERLVRLPMFYGLSSEEIEEACGTIESFFLSHC